MGFLYSQLFVTPKIPSNTSFQGQTIIITGANAGLGKESARHIAGLGVSRLILAVRNIPAGEAARKDILSTTNCLAEAIEVWKLDFSSYDLIKAFATRASQLPRIDVLIQGAGIATAKYVAFEKHESSITTNVIGLFLLSCLLLPKLKASAKEHSITPRLVTVASEVHAWTKFSEQHAPSIFAALDDPNSKTMAERYMTSKLLEVLIIRDIAPRLAGSGVILNMLNPGLNKTTLGGHDSLVLVIMRALLGRKVDVGARTYVAAAVAGGESHGKYMTDGHVDDGALSSFVRSTEGKEVGKRVWSELKQILEDIEPGVTGSV
jgi:NAD(P)-dependent dehydrogenase (short-subunit alcohol dehydrogenase family)